LSNTHPINVVALISGRGSNLQSLINAQQQGKLNVEFSSVISNRDDAAGLQFCERANIPTTVINHTLFKDRLSYDKELIKEIDRHNPYLIILAGFMRILSPEFVAHYSGRLVNIHPSLLPNFKGLHTHQQALDAEATEHGASVHFVTEELDGGPILMQTAVKVKESDDADTLSQRVLKQEHKLYPAAVQLIAERRVELKNGKLYVDDSELKQPLRI
jgi:phosphoribosylglycinamide formyltransferase-1